MSSKITELLNEHCTGPATYHIADLTTNDPRTRAFKKAAAYYHEEKANLPGFSEKGHLTGTREIDWSSAGMLPISLIGFHQKVFESCLAKHDTLDQAVMYLIDHYYVQLTMLSSDYSDYDVDNFIKHTVNALYLEYHAIEGHRWLSD